MSCNIWYALTGLRTGGAELVDHAARLGFGSPIPFDLPTAASQVTDGSGSAPGGFVDDVELANAAYGQAETFVTPLQMALVASTVANGGELMRPRLVTAMSGKGGTRQIGAQTLAHVIDAGGCGGHQPGDGRGRGGRPGPAVHHRREGAGRHDRGQVGHGRARRSRRATLLVHRVRPRGGADDRHRRHRRAGRAWGRGRRADRRRPDGACTSARVADGRPVRPERDRGASAPAH